MLESIDKAMNIIKKNTKKNEGESKKITEECIEILENHKMLIKQIIDLLNVITKRYYTKTYKQEQKEELAEQIETLQNSINSMTKGETISMTNLQYKDLTKKMIAELPNSIRNTPGTLEININEEEYKKSVQPLPIKKTSATLTTQEEKKRKIAKIKNL